MTLQLRPLLLTLVVGAGAAFMAFEVTHADEPESGDGEFIGNTANTHFNPYTPDPVPEPIGQCTPPFNLAWVPSPVQVKGGGIIVPPGPGPNSTVNQQEPTYRSGGSANMAPPPK